MLKMDWKKENILQKSTAKVEDYMLNINAVFDIMGAELAVYWGTSYPETLQIIKTSQDRHLKESCSRSKKD